MQRAKNVPFTLFPSTFFPVCRLLFPVGKAYHFSQPTFFPPHRAVFFSASDGSFLILQILPKIFSCFAYYLYFCACICPLTAGMSSEGDGAWWAEHFILEKRHCTLCFWQLERRKFKPCSETIAEVTPTGVYIRSRSVPRANHALTGTLLGAFCIYSSVGILLCSF